MTLTRLHELGLGGLLAVLAAGRAVPKTEGLSPGIGERSDRTTRAGFSLASPWGRQPASPPSETVYTPRLPFPRKAALMPVLGAVALIVAG